MASGNDMQAHEKTYGAFMNLIKWTLPPILLIGLFVIIQISN